MAEKANWKIEKVIFRSGFIALLVVKWYNLGKGGGVKGKLAISSLISVSCIFIFSFVLWAREAPKDDATRFPNAGSGAIEFTVTPLKENPADYKKTMLLQAGSLDGSEYYELQVIENDLLVLRYFGKCIRSVARVEHDFKQGKPSVLTLAWNNESTKFYINHRQSGSFNLLVRNEQHKFRPFITFSNTDNFTISNINISSESDITVDPADREFVKNCSCPDLAKLLHGKPEEAYRGISLYHFPDENSRRQVRAYIDLLPEGIVKATKKIIFVDDPENLVGSQGVTTSKDTFYLSKTFSPSTFFHEAAHIYDINCNREKSRKWQKEFMKNPAKNTSILVKHDSSTAVEQLAGFVGYSCEAYLKENLRRHFVGRHGEKAVEKLDFLLNEGFITQEIHDKLIAENR